MDLGYLRRIIKIFDESRLSELSIEEEGTKLHFSKSGPVQAFQTASPVQYVHSIPQTDHGVPVQSEAARSEQPVPPPQQYYELRSPIVGTFYRAPSPDAAPYVEIGTNVHQGQVLCIVEAMKLMNEIESDVSGTIVKILPENGQPVEYNQVLFLIDKQ